MKKLINLILLILFGTVVSFAQPTWSVNPGAYSYNMTITAAVSLDYIESTDTNDIVGAFINGECRGVQNLVFDTGTGRYLAYLIVYSNNVSDTIDFKVYDASANTEIAIPVTLDFSVNGITGSTEAPYICSNPTLSSQADILTYSIPGQDGGTVINGTGISVVMPFGTNLTALTADFTNSDHALMKVGGVTQTSGVTVNNFSSPVLYNVRSADETTTQTYTVTISLANAVPTDIYLSKTDVLETAAVGTLIGNLTSEDGNTNDTHTYSLVVGAGDTDNGSFNISGTELQLNTALDFETKTSYNIRLQTDDNKGGLFEKQFTINVIDVNDEIPQVSDAQINLSENTPLQTIYTISATDADISTAFNTLTYSIAGGNDAAKFSIDSSSGVISLISALDFETVNSYELQITASDGTNSGNGVLSITVTDENDETPLVTAVNVQLLENKLPGEQIGQVQASDADANSVLQYSITNGNTDSVFSINQKTGIILLASSVDYEKLESYSLEISVFDSVNTGIGTFTVNIVDVNDEIPHVTSTEINIPETTSVSTAVNTVQATDADANSVFEYSIVSGNTDNRFGINTNTGVLRLLEPLDYENITTYHIDVVVFDGINTGTGTITINVTDENDEIPIVSDETVRVSETELAGLKVTDVIAQDADANTVFSYYIESGNAGNKFLLNQTSGELTLNESLDYELTNSYSLVIRVNDGIHNSYGTIKIDVIALNDEPPVVDSASVSIPENAILGEIVHTVSASDPDGGSVLTYSITAGNTESAFEIEPDHGIITVLGALDYETILEYNIEVTVDDGIHQTSNTIHISIEDVNDEMPQVSDAQINLSEKTPLQTIYTISATDADISTAFNTLTYSITGGNDATKFSIDSSSGVISLISALDFETVNSYELQITASDGTNSGNGVLSITVTDENDETPLVIDGNVQLLENKLLGEQIGQVQASDADANSVLQYSITNGNTDSVFSINQKTGIILLASPVDYEKLESYSLEISVFDSVNTGIGTFTVNIVDVNDEIPHVTSTEINIPETTSVSTAVNTVQATDADANSVFEYSIVSGNTDNRFGINANTGVLRLLEPLDYENITTYYIEVVAFDGINTGTGTITISVTDENDEIPIVSDETVRVSETELAGFKVTDVIAQDADANTVFSYYIESGNAGNKFLLNQTSGELTLNESLDYELTNSYSLVIRVNDGIHNSYGTIKIDVVALNDEPPVVDAANVSIAEDAIFGEIVHTVSASDPDGGAVLTYSITAGNTKSAFEIEPDHGIITVLGALDYETIPEYNIEVTVDDGIHQTSNTIHISIEDINDNAPVVKDTSVNVAENKEQGSVIYTVDAFDVDQNSILSYQIISGNAEEVFAVNSANGDIILSKSLDFEMQNAYTISVLVSDGLHSNSGIITFNIEDINDEFPVFNDTIFSVSEIADTGTVIGYLEATDADANSVLTFSFTDNNQTDFDLSETGELSLATFLNYTNQSEYSFQVEVSDGLNKSYGKLTIQIIDFNESKFEAYNIFSPNGDGINDYWKIKNIEAYRNYTFYIYTNTGQEVYKSEGYNNDWEGKFKGKDLPVGVYYYYVKSPDCPTCRFTGTISLIK